ncbi:MAG: tRNA pseudouridine55 synthase [Planctomycetota bacterium]|jgi:tRNA pseudouridine55 synthase
MGRSARSPKDYRDLDGILIFNKPLGISSNNALQDIRHLFKARKAGHTGSLDPLASGVLPICFGEATKFSSYLLNASKTYRAHCCLGKTTTTGDKEGAVLTEVEVDVASDQLRDVLERFRGEISQIPPMFSALKQQGKRLYQLAREGKEVERQPRQVHIYALQLIAHSGHVVVIDVHCSKGTYIRTLAEDIGKALGCGAYLEGLERTGVAPFWKEPVYTITQLQELIDTDLNRIDALLLPVSAALRDFPELILDESDCLHLMQGRPVRFDAQGKPGVHRISSSDGRFLGLAETSLDGILTGKRLMNTNR